MVEIDVRERNSRSFEFISNQGLEEMDMNLKDMLPASSASAPRSAR
jgi:ATP-dependent HslUV protease ATP-binding subunit HslU